MRKPPFASKSNGYGVVYRGCGTDEYGGFINYDLGIPTTDSVHTDRMSQWNYRKNNDLKIKHFGNAGDYWSGRSPESIQAFLCDYLGKEVTLCRITEYENPIFRLSLLAAGLYL
jgi:hypothetical protein